MLNRVPESRQHASPTQETPPLGRSRLDCDKYFDADARPRADIPDRLRDPLVSVWRLAGFSAMLPGSRRIHPADNALAS